jgi:hypothetical protein
MTARRREMRRLSDVLPAVAAQLGLDTELRTAQAMASWERLVAELVPGAAGATRLVEIRPPQLIVTASDAGTAQELRLRSVMLLEAFARAPGGAHLLELRVSVRPDRDGSNGQRNTPV